MLKHILITIVTCFMLVCFIDIKQAFSYDSQDRCEALLDFCPECNYEEMLELIDDWSYPSSLDKYLENIKHIKSEVENLLVTNGVSKYYIYLALAESGGDVKNVSNKNAKGLWQLMPYISNHYGLKITNKRDDRLDYRKATVVAAKYMQRNLEAFDGNALWAIAAYNAGGTNLKRITNYKQGDSIKIVRKKSYPSYALALTVLKMIYVAECEYDNG